MIHTITGKEIINSGILYKTKIENQSIIAANIEE
jgi:hypothetical protein